MSSMAELTPQWVLIEKTASYMDLSRATVYRLLDRGVLTSTHVGRRHLIDLRSVDRLLEGRKSSGTDAPSRTPADAPGRVS